MAGRVEWLRGYEALPERLRAGIMARLEQRGGRGQASALSDQQTGQVYVFTHVVRTPDRAVTGETMNIFAATDGGRPSSTIRRANRSRARGVRAA